MGNDHNKKNEEKDNLVKKTAKEANNLFGYTVDASGNVIKQVSGKGGLVGKAVDSSSKVLKGASGKATDLVGKTSEAPGKFYKSFAGKGKNKNKSDKD